MSIMNDLENDKSEDGKEFRKQVRQALFFGFVAIAILILMQVFPSDNQYAGILPGICLGLMSALIGSAVNRYKRKKGVNV